MHGGERTVSLTLLKFSLVNVKVASDLASSEIQRMKFDFNDKQNLEMFLHRHLNTRIQRNNILKLIYRQ